MRSFTIVVAVAVIGYVAFGFGWAFGYRRGRREGWMLGYRSSQLPPIVQSVWVALIGALFARDYLRRMRG